MIQELFAGIDIDPPTLAKFERIAEIVKGRESVVFFELGCCDGQHTGQIIKLMPEGYFYFAFEPDVRRIPGLMASVGDKVKVVPKAIGAIDGPAMFYSSSINYYGSSSLRKPTQEMLTDFPKMSFVKNEVEVVTLDTFCFERKIEHIDFIWADIQGCEVDMIAGGKKMLANTDYLLTEYNNGPMYEGNLDLQGILDILPGWTVIEDYDGDALLKNGH